MGRFQPGRLHFEPSKRVDAADLKGSTGDEHGRYETSDTIRNIYLHDNIN